MEFGIFSVGNKYNIQYFQRRNPKRDRFIGILEAYRPGEILLPLIR